MAEQLNLPFPNLSVHGLVSDAVSRGIDLGFYKAHKHFDSPQPETIREHIHQSVMDELAVVIGNQRAQP